MVSLSSAVLVAHSAMAGHDMGDAAVICLAVADTAAAAVAAVTLASAAVRLRSGGPPQRTELAADVPTRTIAAPARAGPADTQVFLL